MVALHVQHNGDSVTSCSVVFQGYIYLLSSFPGGYSLNTAKFSIKVSISGKELRVYLTVPEESDGNFSSSGTFVVPHSTAHVEVRAVLYGGGGGGFDRRHEELLLLCGTTG